MDGRGGCCIARYAGGAYDMSKVDRIMLKFRPIAPKPVAAGSSVSGSTTPPQKSEVPVRTGRWKRRYVKENNKNNNNNNSSNNKRSSSGGNPTGRKRKAPSSEENESSGKTVSAGGETVVTLPLLSESPERKDSVEKVKKTEKNAPIWLSFGGNQANNNNSNDDNSTGGHELQGYGGVVGMDRSVVMFPQPVRVVGSWVKVESVTDAWVEGYGIGRTDEEKLINLDQDNCPGFISDGLNRVRWANKAYKEMMSEGDAVGSAWEIVVWLVMKDDVRLPENKSTAAFTCRVRVVRCGKEKNSLILPCDVWRMDGGGFAWRLDTTAALSLGR